MPLTAQEQRELDELEYEKLKGEKSGTGQTGDPPTAEAAQGPSREELSAQWASSGPLDRLKMIGSMLTSRRAADNFVTNAKEVVDAPINIALEAGGPAVGQAVGAAGGALAPFTVPIGGFIGGVVGDSLAQARSDEKFSVGRAIGAGVTGAITGASLAGAGARQVGREALKYGAANIVGKTVESEMDSGELPTLGEGVTSVALGSAGAVLARVFSKTIKETADDLLYASRNAAFKALRDEGAVVPPHEVGRGSDVISSVGGKAALQQEAAKRNQFVWQKLAREEIGLSKEAIPISLDDLNSVRAAAAEPYKQIQKLSSDAQKELKDKLAALAKEADPHEAMIKLEAPETKKSLAALGLLAGADVDALKEARFLANKARDSFKAGNPTAYDEWIAQRDIAENLEQQIESAATLVGDGSLLKRLQAARARIAKTYSIENALNPATGLVDPIEFGRQFKRKEPLTGNLKKIAEFALSFNREAVEAGLVPAPGVGNLGSMNAVQQASRGNTSGVVGAVVGSTIGRPARAGMLSDFVQDRMLLSPDEQQNFAAALARFIAGEADEPTRRDSKRSEDARR